MRNFLDWGLGLGTGIETWRREELFQLRSHNFWLYLLLMAETLLNYVTKRRNRSSDSSADGRVESPEAKKAKTQIIWKY